MGDVIISSGDFIKYSNLTPKIQENDDVEMIGHDEVFAHIEVIVDSVIIQDLNAKMEDVDRDIAD